MAMKRNAQKESYWRKLVKRQESSGLSIRKFCAAHRISEPSFYAWRRELSLSDREAVATKSRKSSSQPAKDASAFVPLRLIDLPGTLEVIHPLGCQVRITGSLNAAMLKQVLDVLDERGQA